MVSLTRLILRQIVLGRFGVIVTTRARVAIPVDDHGAPRFSLVPRFLPGLMIHVHNSLTVLRNIARMRRVAHLCSSARE